MTKTFHNIHIKSINGDIQISEGPALSVIGGSYMVRNNLLFVTPYHDMTLIIPPNDYQKVTIDSTNGDCSIELEKSFINQLSFNSINGDLEVNAKCMSVHFNSINGDYVRSGNGMQNNTHVSSKTMKVKQLEPLIKDTSGKAWDKREGSEY